MATAGFCLLHKNICVDQTVRIIYYTVMGLLIPEKLKYSYQQCIIDQQKKRILSCCTPFTLVLFGSAAKGQMHELSDIDIALIFTDRQSLVKARTALYTLPPLQDSWPCDLVFYTSKEFLDKLERGGLCEIIREEGQLLYGRWP